MLAVLIHYLSD